MKMIYVELMFENSKLEQIKLNSIRKYKNKYYCDCLFKVRYENEFLEDMLIHLIKKANLEKNPLLINYCYDNISYVKISVPKMNSSELLKNIDTELNNLIPSYKEDYSYRIDKISSFKQNEYRVVLHPKKEELLNLTTLRFKELKINKIKEINNYQVVETIMKSYKYKNNFIYGIICFKDYSIEYYVLRNGMVIELYIVNIDANLLEQYNLSYKYDELLNVNNQYFKKVSEFTNNFASSRNVEGLIMIFNDKYNVYLKKLIDQEIVINHIICNFDDTFLNAIEEVLYEK